MVSSKLHSRIIFQLCKLHLQQERERVVSKCWSNVWKETEHVGGESMGEIFVNVIFDYTVMEKDKDEIKVFEIGMEFKNDLAKAT